MNNLFQRAFPKCDDNISTNVVNETFNLQETLQKIMHITLHGLYY